MLEDLVIDRSALVEFHVDHFHQQTIESVAKGELTHSEAVGIRQKFVESDALQHIVDADVERLTAMLKRQVH